METIELQIQQVGDIIRTLKAHNASDSDIAIQVEAIRKLKLDRDMNMPNYVWIDCEMTGLDVYNDKIIEIACIITDSHLNIIAQAPSIVIHQTKDIMDGMNECK